MVAGYVEGLKKSKCVSKKPRCNFSIAQHLTKRSAFLVDFSLRFVPAGQYFGER